MTEGSIIAAVNNSKFTNKSKINNINEIWFLTDNIDLILDCEDPIYVDTYDELVDELNLRNFIDDEASVVRKRIIGPNDYTLNFLSFPKVLKRDVDYLKSTKAYTYTAKPVVEIHENPSIIATDKESVIRAAKKYGKVGIRRESYFGLDALGNKKRSLNSIGTCVGTKMYIGNDVLIEGYEYAIWAPGARVKHESRLNKSRKKRIKKLGKLPVDTVLIPIFDIVKEDIERVINGTIIGKTCYVELNTYNKRIRTAKVCMGIIADTILSINSMTDEVKYRSGRHLHYDLCSKKMIKKSYAEYLDELRPSMKSLLKSKDSDKKRFATVMISEMKAFEK